MTQATTTATLSKSEFVARTTVFLRPVTRRYNAMSGSARLEAVMRDICRYARYNEPDGIPATYNMVAYAVEWSMTTLRLNHGPEAALRAMKVRDLVGIVYDLHQACATQIEVTYALNKRFAEFAA